MTFWKDFKGGFKKGWNGAKSVVDHVLGLNAISKELPKLHKGGKVPKTGNYRLRGGEVVLNKTQQRRIKNAKTQKTAMKVFNKVKSQNPKPMKARKKR